MRRFLLFAALLSTWTVGAATISSTTCTSSDTSGCYTSYAPSYPAILYMVEGTWSGSLIFEGSATGTNFVRLAAYYTTGGEALAAVTENGTWYVSTAGLSYIRIRAESWTSGTATVTPRAVSASLASAAPAGGLPVTLGAQRVAVEATGPAGGPVVTELTQQTLDFLNPAPRTCVINPALRIALPATPTTIPRLLPDGGYPALSGRTLIHAINSDDKDRVVCDVARSDGGLPDCVTPTVSVDGNGLPLDPNGGSHDFQLADTVRLYCLACVGSGTAEFTYQEDSCAQQ